MTRELWLQATKDELQRRAEEAVAVNSVRRRILSIPDGTAPDPGWRTRVRLWIDEMFLQEATRLFGEPNDDKALTARRKFQAGLLEMIYHEIKPNFVIHIQPHLGDPFFDQTCVSDSPSLHLAKA